MDSLVGSALGLGLCTAAGFSGAFAAVFGKLAGQEGLDLTTKAVFYALLIACNGLMLVLYSRSLRHNSSLASTACATAVNISATGLLGRYVFGEAASLQWWAGAASIVLGSVLINRSQNKEAAAAAAAAPAAVPAPAAGKAEPAGGEGEEEEEPARKGGARRRTRRD